MRGRGRGGCRSKRRASRVLRITEPHVFSELQNLTYFQNHRTSCVLGITEPRVFSESQNLTCSQNHRTSRVLCITEPHVFSESQNLTCSQNHRTSRVLRITEPHVFSESQQHGGVWFSLRFVFLTMELLSVVVSLLFSSPLSVAAHSAIFQAIYYIHVRFFSRKPRSSL